MSRFKDDQLLIIAIGSQTTQAQLAVQDPYTPATIRIPSRMFPGETPGKWEAVKIREKGKGKQSVSSTNGVSGNLDGSTATSADNTAQAPAHEEPIYEEDPLSEDGAVYPLKHGRIVNLSCLYGLIEHVYNKASPPFHTAVLLVSQPAWTVKDKENITQFMFEKFKIPAFNFMDAAQGAQFSYSPTNCLVINIGHDKADITAIVDYSIIDVGRGIALDGCGGEGMTRNLHRLLGSKGFTYEMCEQLKRNNICEVLPPNTPLPSEENSNPAAAATTGVNTGTSGQKGIVGQSGLPRGPGVGTEAGNEFDGKDADDNDGVLDVASIVASGKTSEFLAKKDREKAEKAASKKSNAEAAAAAKVTKLPNSQRAKAIFQYEERKSPEEVAGTGPKAVDPTGATVDGEAPTEQVAEMSLSRKEEKRRAKEGGSMFVRKEIEVGVERFHAVSADVMLRICDAAYRCVQSIANPSDRGDVWENVIIHGQGSKVKGFKEALLATLTAKYLISPSSGTIFTSELPSNFSTPLATGANTPMPQAQVHHAPGVNPLLIAATTASNHNLAPPGHHQQQHYGTGQNPKSIKHVKAPEYFSEFKEVGMDECDFLGGQIMAKLIFVLDQGPGPKSYLTRQDYNDLGPSAIHDYKNV